LAFLQGDHNTDRDGAYAILVDIEEFGHGWLGMAGHGLEKELGAFRCPLR